MIVFVSGAAGLLGGALVEELTGRGHGVIALVHSDASIKGNDARPIPAAPYDGSAPKTGEALVLKGDVTQPSLGLGEAQLAAVQAQVDCVIHCAALVRFEADFEDLKAVNIDGTVQIAKSFPKVRFIHVSTAYVCGIANGRIAETVQAATGPFSNGYEKSKAIAEEQLLSVRPDAIIARPSIVVGEHESGAIRSFDAIYRAFKFIAEGRMEALPVAANASLNLVPIDYVVCGLADLIVREESDCAIVHLAAREAFCAQRFLDLVRGVSGLDKPIAISCETAPEASSGLLARSLGPYLSYFTRNPEFETSNADRMIQTPAPTIDDAALLRQIHYCVKSGFIKLD